MKTKSNKIKLAVAGGKRVYDSWKDGSDIYKDKFDRHLKNKFYYNF